MLGFGGTGKAKLKKKSKKFGFGEAKRASAAESDGTSTPGPKPASAVDITPDSKDASIGPEYEAKIPAETKDQAVTPTTAKPKKTSNLGSAQKKETNHSMFGFGSSSKKKKKSKPNPNSDDRFDASGSINVNSLLEDIGLARRTHPEQVPLAPWASGHPVQLEYEL